MSKEQLTEKMDEAFGRFYESPQAHEQRRALGDMLKVLLTAVLEGASDE